MGNEYSKQLVEERPLWDQYVNEEWRSERCRELDRLGGANGPSSQPCTLRPPWLYHSIDFICSMQASAAPLLPEGKAFRQSFSSSRLVWHGHVNGAA